MNCLKFISLITVGALFSTAHAETANDAWNGLLQKQHKGKAAFDFVENDKAKANVLIYGDSISIGYTSTVRNLLKNDANVYRLHCNGGDSASFIGKMEMLQKTMRNPSLENPWNFEWDIIHFNVGLHDLKYVLNGQLDKMNGKQVASTDTYKKNLTEIIAYLKKTAPNAKLIFATITPIPEAELGRIIGDEKKYNAAAMEVFRRHPEIKFNDLNALTTPNHVKWQRKYGDVHYNEIGEIAQGKQVAASIRAALK